MSILSDIVKLTNEQSQYNISFVCVKLHLYIDHIKQLQDKENWV